MWYSTIKSEKRIIYKYHALEEAIMLLNYGATEEAIDHLRQNGFGIMVKTDG